MAEVAAHGPGSRVRRRAAKSSPRRPRRGTGEWYRRELQARYEAYFHRSPHRKQLAAMAAFAKWIDLRCARGDTEILRTVGQIIDGPGKDLGWTHTGTCRGDHDKYRNRIANQLDYLTALGWVAERRYGVDTATLKGLGIIIVPGPCSSTGAAAAVPPRFLERVCQERRRRPNVADRRGAADPRPRRFLGESFAPPLWEDSLRSSGNPLERAVGGRTRPPRVTQSSAAAARDAIAALERWWREGRGEDASAHDVLEAVPELRSAPPLPVLRALFGLAHPRGMPIISPKWRDRLEVAMRRADRYADLGRGRQGAGLELAISLVLDDDRQPLGFRPQQRARDKGLTVALPVYEQPQTLGAIAVLTRREANRWRRHARARRAAAC